MKRLITYLLPALAGAIIGYIGAVYLDISEFSMVVPEWYTIVGLILIFIPFTILVHELGHLAMGLINGYTFRFLTVGLIKLEHVDGHFQWDINTELNTMGGLTLMFPSKSFTRGQMIAYYAGGPIVSVVFGIIMIALSSVVPPENEWMFGLGMLGVISIAIGLVSLLPLPSSTFATDGTQILDFVQGGNRGIRKLFLLKIVAQSTRGVRPSKWEHSTFQKYLSINEGEDDSYACYAYLYAFYHYMDTGEKETAINYLCKAKELVDDEPNIIKSAVYLEMAFKEAYKEKNADYARELQSQITTSLVERASLLRLESACLMAEERWEEAESSAVEAISYIGKAMDKGVARLQIDWLNIMYEEIHSNFRQKTLF